MWDEVAFLLSESMEADEAGDTTMSPTERQVFVNEISVGQNEFYQAHANGLRPEIKLELNKLDYGNEQKIKYKEVVYKVIRTYKKGDIIEITLEGDVHGIT